MLRPHPDHELGLRVLGGERVIEVDGRRAIHAHPVLALLGDKDVLVSAEENAPLLRKSLARGNNRDASLRVLPGLNHMFQTARTGAMEEAGDIEETFAPSALRLIGEWVVDRTRTAAPGPPR